MVRAQVFAAVALVSLSASAASKHSRATFEVLIEASDCGELIRAPLPIPLSIGETIKSSIDGSNGSAIAWQTTLLTVSKVKIQGTFFSRCGEINPDFTVAIGQTVTYTNGKSSLSIRVRPSS